ncbi:MAG: hypothetical protein HKP21_07615, partial [Xanthomonadales bacterium]|nr:hypothetical protein [Gammaproteobacteria bacterium]NNK04404.1 hypothetical protein [Xanthomonadales bacterium]
QAASQTNSPVSKEAQTELVLMELPQNPGKYIQSAALLDRGGKVVAAVRNTAPVAVDSIRVKVEYIDSNRQFREFSLRIPGTLEEGQQTSVPTKIGDIVDTNDLGRRVRVTVTAARVAE